LFNALKNQKTVAAKTHSTTAFQFLLLKRNTLNIELITLMSSSKGAHTPTGLRKAAMRPQASSSR